MKNIETIMKFCSKLTEIFEYPYYFNWSAPTNHIDNSPDGKMTPINYIIFRVGKYNESSEEEFVDFGEVPESAFPIEKQLFFGSIHHVTMFIPLNGLINTGKSPVNLNEPINSFEKVEEFKDILKKHIDNFLIEN